MLQIEIAIYVQSHPSGLRNKHFVFYIALYTYDMISKCVVRFTRVYDETCMYFNLNEIITFKLNRKANK